MRGITGEDFFSVPIDLVDWGFEGWGFFWQNRRTIGEWPLDLPDIDIGALSS